MLSSRVCLIAFLAVFYVGAGLRAYRQSLGFSLAQKCQQNKEQTWCYRCDVLLTDRPMPSADRPSKKRKEPPSGGQAIPEEADGRRKKARTTFTGRQIFELERQFEIKKYLSSTERSDMAKLLSVTETQVSFLSVRYTLILSLPPLPGTRPCRRLAADILRHSSGRRQSCHDSIMGLLIDD